MERVVNELTKLNDKSAELNNKVDKIIGIMEKPDNKLLKVMTIIGNAATIAGLIAVADIIRNWITGG